MDFKEEIKKELGLAVESGVVLFDDYARACENIAKKYHKMRVEELILRVNAQKRKFKGNYKKH